MSASEADSSPAGEEIPAPETDRPLGAGIAFTDPASPLAPYYLRLTHVLTVAFLVLVFLLLNFVPLWHTDVWGHLAFGRWVLEHAALPDRDPFCPFAATAPTAIHYCWLGQLSYYAVFRLGEILAGPQDALAGGVDLLRFAHALLVATRLAILFFAFRRLSGSGAWALAGVFFLWAVNLGNYGICRPQVLGELCFAVLLLALSRPVPARAALFLIPLLLALWANTHGSYAIGLVLLAGVLLARLADVAWNERTLRPRHLLADARARRLLICLAGSVLAVGLLNPWGPFIYWNTLRMATHAGVTAMDEWQPLHFNLGPGGHWGYLATVVVLFAGQMLSPRWFSPGTVVLILLFGLQPLAHQRALVWWLVLTPWILMPYLAAVGDRFARWRWESVPSLRKTIVAGLLVCVAIAWSIPTQWLLAGHPQPLERSLSYGTPWQLARQLQEPDRIWSHRLNEVLRQNYPGGRFTGTLFTSETLGDYFVWLFGPDPPVFIYTHIHLFPPEHWELCTRVRAGATDWRAILDRFRANLVVVEPERNVRLCAQIRQDADWQVILDEAGDARKRDERGRLFVAVRQRPVK
jgi:hypothetical protein